VAPQKIVPRLNLIVSVIFLMLEVLCWNFGLGQFLSGLWIDAPRCFQHIWTSKALGVYHSQHLLFHKPKYFLLPPHTDLGVRWKATKYAVRRGATFLSPRLRSWWGGCGGDFRCLGLCPGKTLNWIRWQGSTSRVVEFLEIWSTLFITNIPSSTLARSGTSMWRSYLWV